MTQQRRTYLSYLYSPQPTRAGAALFWRVHWGAPDRPLTREDAWSVPWGVEEEERATLIAEAEAAEAEGRQSEAIASGWLRRGYSACRSPEALYAYFAERGGLENYRAPVVAFWGVEVGIGHDDEPLVMPIEDAPTHFIPAATVAALVERRWESGILERRDAARRAAAERAREAAAAAAAKRAQEEMIARLGDMIAAELAGDFWALSRATSAFWRAVEASALVPVLAQFELRKVVCSVPAALAPHIPPMYRR